jgi:hypothetical protein
MSDDRTPRWLSPVPIHDDFGDLITDEFIDGKTKAGGAWGLMTPKSWAIWSGTGGRLGTGLGQRYKKDPVKNYWPKVEG